MVWQEILAWAVIVAAFAVAVVWCVRRIVCPASKCDSCDKSCMLRKKNK